MTYNPFIHMTIGDDCHKPDATNKGFIVTYWASGNRHYCKECWPSHRDFYENESGRQAWKQIGNSYVPNE